MESFGKSLAEKRNERGFSQGFLAKEIGVPQSTIARYESGRNVPLPKNRIKLCRALGVTDDFFENTNKEKVDNGAVYLQKLNLVNDFSRRDRQLVIDVIDAIIKRNLWAATAGKQKK